MSAHRESLPDAAIRERALVVAHLREHLARLPSLNGAERALIEMVADNIESGQHLPGTRP